MKANEWPKREVLEGMLYTCRSQKGYSSLYGCVIDWPGEEGSLERA